MFAGLIDLSLSHLIALSVNQNLANLSSILQTSPSSYTILAFSSPLCTSLKVAVFEVEIWENSIQPQTSYIVDSVLLRCHIRGWSFHEYLSAFGDLQTLEQYLQYSDHYQLRSHLSRLPFSFYRLLHYPRLHERVGCSGQKYEEAQ